MKPLLDEAVSKTKATGSSTFVIAMLFDDADTLKALNLGDSVVYIFRPNPNTESGLELTFKSPDQMEGYNHPY